MKKRPYLADGVERWARRTPDATALEDEHGQKLSYQELDRLANRMAHHLRRRGVRSGDRVGLCLPKSIQSVVGLLGSLKLGAVYVPVDVGSPPERNRFIFKDCQTRVVLTDEPRSAQLGEADYQVVFPGDTAAGLEASWLADEPEGPIEIGPGGDELAYILYTSGSTGVPKGVVHSHASAMSFVHWAIETFEPHGKDRISSHAPFHFDLSIFDLYVPWEVAATLVLVGEALGKNPQKLAQYIADKKISLWYSTPSILALLAQYGRLERFDYSALRGVLFAGEVFPIQHLRKVKELWPGPAFYNLFGPTETNVCTYYPIPHTIEKDRDRPYPIGKPCSNVEALVLDERLRPVSGCDEGVLYIHASGPVMQGYWSAEEKTAQAFWTAPNGRRWYRTGDVVALDDEGHYVFLGRRDRMVKRHGYRIELDEIEAGIYRHPAVREAAAIAKEGPEGTRIAVYISVVSKTRPSIIELKKHCARHLPPYMSPDKFNFLERLPRTSTNKIDYQSLMRQES